MTTSNLVLQHQQKRSEQRRVNLTASATGILATIRFWLQRSIQRRHLAHLDDHQLQDIGISREQASREAAKPFWK